MAALRLKETTGAMQSAYHWMSFAGEYVYESLRPSTAYRAASTAYHTVRKTARAVQKWSEPHYLDGLSVSYHFDDLKHRWPYYSWRERFSPTVELGKLCVKSCIFKVIFNVSNALAAPRSSAPHSDSLPLPSDVTASAGRDVITQRRHLDTASRRLHIFPTLQRAHVIEDPELIRVFLQEPREGDLLEFGFQELFQPALGRNTMLTCSNEEHARLRGCCEKFFSPKNLYSRAVFDPIVLAALDRINKGYSKNNLTVVAGVPYAVMRMILGTTDDLNNYDSERAIGGDAECLRRLENGIGDIFRYKRYIPGSLLEALAQDETLTQEEKERTCILLMSAGMRTTTTLTKCVVDTLMRSPELRKELRKSWDASYPSITDNDPEAFCKALHAFVEGSELLERYYKEATRLFPSIPIIKRVAKKNLQVGTLVIRAGDEIHLNVMGYQRNPTYWPDPTHFNPGRFKTSKNPLFTFSVGHERCLGMHLAKMEIKIVVALTAIFLDVTARSKGFIPVATRKHLPFVALENGFDLTVAKSMLTTQLDENYERLTMRVKERTGEEATPSTSSKRRLEEGAREEKRATASSSSNVEEKKL